MGTAASSGGDQDILTVETAVADGAPEMLDLQFALRGASVPHDYGDALWAAVRGQLPWLEQESQTALHPLYGLSPGVGLWYLSRRSRLVLRVPRARAAAARLLADRPLRLGDHQMEATFAAERELQYSAVLYARFVTYGAQADGAAMPESVFVERCRREFDQMGIAPQMICGKAQSARTVAGQLSGFSVLVTGIPAEANLLLQRQGLGCERMRGCGIFVPHKSMASVVTPE